MARLGPSSGRLSPKPSFSLSLALHKDWEKREGKHGDKRKAAVLFTEGQERISWLFGGGGFLGSEKIDLMAALRVQFLTSHQCHRATLLPGHGRNLMYHLTDHRQGKEGGTLRQIAYLAFCLRLSRPAEQWETTVRTAQGGPWWPSVVGREGMRELCLKNPTHQSHLLFGSFWKTILGNFLPLNIPSILFCSWFFSQECYDIEVNFNRLEKSICIHILNLSCSDISESLYSPCP